MNNEEQEQPTIDGNTSYARAYWAWLRGETEKQPDPSEHGVPMFIAEGVRTQCDIEYARGGKGRNADG